ncbi:MAG TPA: regulatory protein RecX [Flavobacteriaceae bacterium]|nr:regulatory protein RecX [Flavobacteriaceae bacterium]
MTRQKTYTVDQALERLKNYCAYQERCHMEVRTKLQSMGMIPEAVDVIVTALIQHDFLNESRFAKSYARGKLKAKHWGKQRIVRELKQREISKFNIEQALKEISEEEYLTSFSALAQKRVAQIKEKNRYKKRKKLADYLLYRGWESSLVYDKVIELVP